MRRPSRDLIVPAVLGHEGFGVVEAVGEEVSDVAVGQAVVISFAWCGSCPPCARGQRAYCENSYALNFDCCRPDGSTSLEDDGHPVGSHFFGQSSFATHCVVPARRLVVVHTEVDPAVAAPLGCGVQTGAGSVFNVFEAGPGSSLAVLGCGSVGLAAVMAARLAGVDRIVGVDLVRARRDLAA